MSISNRPRRRADGSGRVNGASLGRFHLAAAMSLSDIGRCGRVVRRTALQAVGRF
jgi:hypothetical protein